MCAELNRKCLVDETDIIHARPCYRSMVHLQHAKNIWILYLIFFLFFTNWDNVSALSRFLKLESNHNNRICPFWNIKRLTMIRMRSLNLYTTDEMNATPKSSKFKLLFYHCYYEMTVCNEKCIFVTLEERFYRFLFRFKIRILV